jgi:hypothetical protein
MKECFKVEPIPNRRIKGWAVLCNLPLIELTGDNAKILAEELASELNTAFEKIFPKIADLALETKKQHMYWAKKNHSNTMCEAILFILRRQKDNHFGPINWREIVMDHDFNFDRSLYSVFNGNRTTIKKARSSIQGAISYLRSKGIDIETVNIPGKGASYSLC